MQHHPEIRQEEPRKKKRDEREEFLLATNMLHRELVARLGLKTNAERTDWIMKNGGQIREYVTSDPELRNLVREDLDLAADAVLHRLEIDKKKAA